MTDSNVTPPTIVSGAVVSEISGLQPVVRPDLAALSEEAAFELARFDATMGGELASYGAILLRGEAASSSRIEGIKNSPTRSRLVPPHHDRVHPAIEDLSDFIDRNDVPVLVQAAIAHAQFEAIHPFNDGNGRTGRAIVHAILRRKELTRNTAVPVSAGLLAERDADIAVLQADRAGDIEPIVRSLSTATLAAVEHGSELVRQSRAVRQEWAGKLTGIRSDSAAHALADGLIAHPVITAHHARDILPGRANVHRYIDVLVKRGVLIPRQDHRTRNMTWRAEDVLDLLDNYAERIGRHSR